MTSHKQLWNSGFFGLIIVCTTMFFVLSGTAQAEWEPEKPIDLVIMAGKDGGADKMARLMQRIIEENGWSPQRVIPINRPGGSGVEAMTYLARSPDPDYTLLVTLNSFYTTPLRQPKLQLDIETFTPIARMAEDNFVLWVHQNSGITSLEAFVAAAREKGEEWVMAGTGRHAEDHLLTQLLNLTFRLNMTYVPYKGGGKVARQLALGHIDSTVNNPSEQLEHYEAGLTVPVAVFSKERLATFPETPTFRERGEVLDYLMQRSVVGAPGMSAAASAFYQDLFAKVFRSAEWMAYRNSKSLHGELLQGDALMEYWIAERAAHHTMLRALGIID